MTLWKGEGLAMDSLCTSCSVWHDCPWEGGRGYREQCGDFQPSAGTRERPMSKIIRITSCIQCPHILKSVSLPDEGGISPVIAFCCGKGSETWGRAIHPAEVDARVPDWCQLEDVSFPEAEHLKAGYLRELTTSNALRSALKWALSEVKRHPFNMSSYDAALDALGGRPWMT